MSRHNTGSASNWLAGAASSPPVSAYPLTIWLEACLFSTAAIYNLINIGNTAGNQYWAIYANTTNGSAVTAGRISFSVSNNVGGEFLAVTAGAIAVGQWFQVMAGGSSATSRFCILNGLDKGTETTNKTPTVDHITVGAYRAGSTFGAINGIIGRVAVWSAALPDGAAIQFRQGADPAAFQPADLKAFYMPSSDNGYGGIVPDVNPYRPRKFDLTVNGTMELDTPGPWVQPSVEPKRRYWRMGNVQAAGPLLQDLEHQPGWQPLMAM